jgi:hypothetical protein
MVETATIIAQLSLISHHTSRAIRDVIPGVTSVVYVVFLEDQA